MFVERLGVVDDAGFSREDGQESVDEGVKRGEEEREREKGDEGPEVEELWEVEGGDVV